VSASWTARLAHRASFVGREREIVGVAVVDGSVLLELHRSSNRGSRGSAPLPASPSGAFQRDVFSPAECSAIVEILGPLAVERSESAVVDDPDSSYVGSVLPAIGSGDRVAAAVVKRMTACVLEVNAATWGHDALEVPSVNIMRYVVGDAKCWHVDGGIDPSRHWIGFIAVLSDPSTYEGGELQFQSARGDLRDGPMVKPPAGTAFVLSGDYLHRVAPVTAGERWSLTAFICTPPLD
jgi:hypothetical protein